MVKRNLCMLLQIAIKKETEMGLHYFFYLIDLIAKDVLLCYQEKIADRFSQKGNFCHLYQ